MKIALMGATGFVGSAIFKEALDRGHEVTAVARHPETLQPHPKLHAHKADMYNVEDLSPVLAGHEAVISAFSPEKTDPDIREKHVQGIRTLTARMSCGAMASKADWRSPSNCCRLIPPARPSLTTMRSVLDSLWFTKSHHEPREL